MSIYETRRPDYGPSDISSSYHTKTPKTRRRGRKWLLVSVCAALLGVLVYSGIRVALRSEPGDPLYLVSISAVSDKSVGVDADGVFWYWGNASGFNEPGRIGGHPVAVPIYAGQFQDRILDVFLQQGGALVTMTDGVLVHVGMATGRQGPVRLYDPVILETPWGNRSIAHAATRPFWSSPVYVIDEGGAVWGWGRDTHCQFGDNPETRNGPGRILGELGDQRVHKLVVTDTRVVALTDDGPIAHWGMGTDWVRRQCEVAVLEPPWSGNVTRMSSWRDAVTFLIDDEILWCWSHESTDSGTILDGCYADAPVVMDSPLTDRRIVGIEGHGGFSIALADDGTVWGWGAMHRRGQGPQPIVLGEPDDPSIPRQIPASWGDQRIVAIATGDEHAVALAEDGSAWAWGHNSVGQLGDGTTTPRDVPVRVRR